MHTFFLSLAREYVERLMKHHSNDQKTCNLRLPMVSQFGSFFGAQSLSRGVFRDTPSAKNLNLMVACGMVARGLNLASLVFGIWSKQSMAEHQRVYGRATTIEATKAEIIAALNKFDKREAEIAVGQFSQRVESVATSKAVGVSANSGW